jgi:15-cis-phytoene desaturase
VVFHTAVQVNGFELDGGRVCPVQATENGNPFQIAASYYIAAMPVDVMSTLLTPALKAAAPSLANLDRLQTRWMNGIQFYLRRDVPLVRGHAIYLDSPWALTSVSQRQFWTGVDLSSFGDGTVGGILSVDISEWEQPGVLYDKPAMQCTATENRRRALDKAERSQAAGHGRSQKDRFQRGIAVAALPRLHNSWQGHQDNGVWQ